MANQNLFEKYGIKEVADVTFYRIEKKEETYESQREITASSILKGAIETRTVYPLENGQGADEGFDAYVFTDADILTGTNYDCDDEMDVVVDLKVTYESTVQKSDEELVEIVNQSSDGIAGKKNSTKLIEFATGTEGAILPEGFSNVTIMSVINNSSKIEIPASKIKNTSISEKAGTNAETTALSENISYKNVSVVVKNTAETSTLTVQDNTAGSYQFEDVKYNSDEITCTVAENKTKITYTKQSGIDSARISFKVINKDKTVNEKAVYGNGSIMVGTVDNQVKIVIREPQKFRYNLAIQSLVTSSNTADMATGIFNTVNATVADENYIDGIGTHEYSYEQQVAMLFARRQNLITKAGVRYQFPQTDTMFGEIAFNDQFTSAPKSREQIVVVGIAGRFTDNTYDMEEINNTIKKLTETYSAKAYDVVYEDYAELVVEDEMGYFRPDFLGYEYVRENGKGTITTFQDTIDYKTWIETQDKVGDPALANIEMWEDGEHWSINDAIDALRQKQKIIDASEASGLKGLNKIFGGYEVSSKNNNADAVDPTVGIEDTEYESNTYRYSAGETEFADIKSNYSLDDVTNAVNSIALQEAAFGKDIRVDANGKKSNRAIYIRVDGSVDTAAGAYIYLLHNKNYRNLAQDEDGIFSFEDKKGNTLYYQDKIFKGVEWLALVVLGAKGIIFVVNRHGNTDVDRIAWMVNENGYIDNRKAAMLVKNGLIHTTDIIVNDETFEATCSVKSLKIRKIQKTTNRYVPVLFLDTLKISTLEQTAEETYATGGQGNANLIGWDYGKEITLTLEDALFTPASMSAIFGSYEGNDFRKGVKEVKQLDRMEKVTAKRSFIVPAGNRNGTPTEADKTAQAVFYDPKTMEPYADGTPIAEGEVFYKWTRSVAYEGNSIGHMIEISADKFPGTYKVVGDTFVRSKETGEDERFQFVIPQAKMTSEQTITLEADGDPAVNFYITSNAAVKIA